MISLKPEMTNLDTNQLTVISCQYPDNFKLIDRLLRPKGLWLNLSSLLQRELQKTTPKTPLIPTVKELGVSNLINSLSQTKK